MQVTLKAAGPARQAWQQLEQQLEQNRRSNPTIAPFIDQLHNSIGTYLGSIDSKTPVDLNLTCNIAVEQFVPAGGVDQKDSDAGTWQKGTSSHYEGSSNRGSSFGGGGESRR